ncbi:hypothetical protein RJT34_25278 [Clitoria ternatea]|uniref:Gnk2-homologous domain-containing protein n=1 Tax=Clitoria ternatea TaxID=43366 RepID=A0AAN9FS83_CLITE
MATGSFRLILCCVFVIIISESSAQTCDNEKGNFTINSTYHKNLNTLLSSFSSYKHINYGFYNISYGENPDKVYAIGLCRGDQTQDQCLSCLNDSRVSLAQNCPNQKEAITWPGECMLRYSNRSIFGVLETRPEVKLILLRNATIEHFQEVLQLFLSIIRTAASGDSRRKYATGNASAPEFQTIYAYVQCTPDLSSDECTNCLNEAITGIVPCCLYQAGSNVLRPSCRIRYDPYLFYGPTLKLEPDAPSSPLPSPSTNNTPQGKSNSSLTATAIAVPVVVVVVLVLSFTCIYTRVRKRRHFFQIEDDNEIKTNESLQFPFATIRVATNDFSNSNKLGQGGFGAVYRAWRNWRNGLATNIIDPILNNGSQSEMMRCIHIGLLCVQENVADRPTMIAVVRMLNSDSVTLPIPTEPAFYMENRSGNLQDMQQWEFTSTATQQLNGASQKSVNEVSVTELYPR